MFSHGENTMVRLNRKLALGLAAAVGLGAMTTASEATTKLTLVHPFPDFLIYTKQCKALVDHINKIGKGVIEIEVKPFNSIKMFQQPTAVSKGIVDLACTPAAFYARAIPENEAISTASATVMDARANGGIKLIDDLHQKKFNMKYLGWTSSGNNFRIYLANPPKFNDKGLPDFSGVKMRDNPIYGAFLRALKASTHNIPSTGVYSALEKHRVDGSPWATLGLINLKWDKFLRHGIEPVFYQTDIGWIMNLDKWKSLSPEAQKLLQDAVIQSEIDNYKVLTGLADAERKKLADGGMKFHQVPAAAEYLKIAVDSAFERMTERLTEAKEDTAIVAELRSKFQK